jgi:hypothetical protein
LTKLSRTEFPAQVHDGGKSLLTEHTMFRPPALVISQKFGGVLPPSQKCEPLGEAQYRSMMSAEHTTIIISASDGRFIATAL